MTSLVQKGLTKQTNNLPKSSFSVSKRFHVSYTTGSLKNGGYFSPPDVTLGRLGDTYKSNINGQTYHKLYPKTKGNLKFGQAYLRAAQTCITTSATYLDPPRSELSIHWIKISWKFFSLGIHFDGNSMDART